MRFATGTRPWLVFPLILFLVCASSRPGLAAEAALSTSKTKLDQARAAQTTVENRLAAERRELDERQRQLDRDRRQLESDQRRLDDDY